MARVYHFEIPADDPERAIAFYRDVFGWMIQKKLAPNEEYWLVMTGGRDEAGINGGIKRRARTTDRAIPHIEVESLEDTSKQIVSNGGTVVSERISVKGTGYLMYCLDCEGNTFAIVEKRTIG